MPLIPDISRLLTGIAPGGVWYMQNQTQPPKYPYIVFQRITSTSNNTLDGPSQLQNTRVQFDVYARTAADADAVAGSMAYALQTASDRRELVNVPLLSQDLLEFETRSVRKVMDYSFWTCDDC